MLYGSLILVVVLATLIVKFYARFLANEKKGKQPESMFALRYDDSDEECLETSSLLRKSSFMQQISTGSNTDSDLRVMRMSPDNDSSYSHLKLKNQPNARITNEEEMFKRKVP